MSSFSIPKNYMENLFKSKIKTYIGKTNIQQEEQKGVPLKYTIFPWTNWVFYRNC